MLKKIAYHSNFLNISKENLRSDRPSPLKNGDLKSPFPPFLPGGGGERRGKKCASFLSNFLDFVKGRDCLASSDVADVIVLFIDNLVVFIFGNFFLC